MPRYFFNILRGKTAIPDPEGDSLPSDAAAIRHASMVAREMIEERHKYSRRNMKRWAFDIKDGAAMAAGIINRVVARIENGRRADDGADPWGGNGLQADFTVRRFLMRGH